MKLNSLKYFFIIFIIVILIFSIFKIKGQENINKKIITKEEENEIINKEIKLGVASFDTMNPILTQNKNVQDISKLIYDSLITLKENYQAENCLAQEWAKQNDKEYIIKLRNDVKWSDGKSFTSEDVKFTIETIKNSDSIYKSNVEHIVNVEVIDNTIVKILLDKEIPFFEYNLVFPIIQKDFYKNRQVTKDLVPLGTGMYKVSQIQNSSLVLDKNENYWGNPENLTLEKITINMYSTIGELYNSFKMGNIDLISTQNSKVSDYVGTIGYVSKEMKGREHDFLVFNTKNNILSQLSVRKAIAYSIDKSNIVSSIFNNTYYVSTFPLDYGNWVYKEQDLKLDYNIEQAKQILIEDGWQFKYKYWQKTVNYYTQKISLNLVVKASDELRLSVAENIKSQLETLGIHINLIKATDNQYKNYLSNKNYDIILCSTDLSISPDLSTFFGENNLANYSNDEINSIMNEIKNTTDETKIKELYLKLEKIYKTEIPYLSLYNNKYTVAYNTEISGNVTPNWFYQFYNINSWHK